MQTNHWLRSFLLEPAGDGAGGEGGGSGGGGGTTTLLGGTADGGGAADFKPATFDGVLNPDGTFKDGWTAGFNTKEAAYNGPLAGVKSLADVDKVLRENMAAARGKAPAMPDDKATPEQVAAWRKITGAPEKPEGYGDLRPETIPAELWDKGSEAKLQAIAHKHHLPPAALKDIVGMYAETLGEAVKTNEADTQARLSGELGRLKQEWGGEFDAKLHSAKRFALTLGLKEDNPIFQSAEAVLAMARGAALVSEDKLINGNTSSLAATPKQQANEIMTNTANPLYAKYQAGDKDTVALVNNLLMQGA